MNSLEINLLKNLQTMPSCDFPFYVANPRKAIPGVPYQERVPIPCGRCPSCLSRRTQIWQARLQIEERDHSSALFVTLTYEHPPLSPKKFMTLDKKHVQLYIKRIRKLTNCKTIKYYAVGEYGSENWRPHYHLILYDVLAEDAAKCWEEYDDSTNTYVTGKVYIGTVQGASIAYTTKYLNKGKRVPVHQNDDRLPEFSLMSKGLGDRYLRSVPLQKWHQDDASRSFMLREGGVKVPLPRHWRDKIYTPEQRDYQAAKIQALVEEDEAKRKDEYKALHGSLDHYERSRTEAKIEQIRKVQNTALTKRM